MTTTTSLPERAAERAQLAFPAPLSAAFLLAGAAATAVYFVLPPDAQSVWYVVIGFASVAAIYAGALRNARDARTPWLLFAGGLLCQVAGDATFAIYEVRLDREPPVPSVADAFYLAGYPLLALAILLLLRRLGGQRSRAAVLDAVILFVAVGMVQWVFLIDPLQHLAAPRAERVVDMAYPAMDVFLLVGFGQLLVGQGRRTTSYRLLLVSVALWVVADELYGLSDSYTGGDWIDALWLLSYVTWAAAALEPSASRLVSTDRRAVPRLTSTRLVVLAAALLTAPAILVAERIANHRVHALVIAIGAAVIAVLALQRLGGLVRSVERARRDERLARRDAENAQRLLFDQNEQLRELDRLKDEFVSSVSHELRTPLTSITGYVELLLEEEDDAEARRHLEIVDRNAQRLLGLVSDLLFAARLQSGRLELERERVDLRALVDESVAAARPRAEAARVELRASLDEEVPPVDGEPVRLAQLLDNLVSNAIKFTPAGGRIDISLSASDDGVCLEVSDTGIGISDEERAHLFDRFFRAQSALEHQIQGTGLGLYISKAIVDAHGGRIAVRSGEGTGTTFLVELPAGEAA